MVLSAGRILQSYETVLLQSLNALDLPEVTFRISLVFFVTNIVGNVVLTWQIGAVGAAIATAGSIGLATFLSLNALRRHVAVQIHWRTLASQLASALTMGVVVQVALRWVDGPGIVTVLGLVLLGVGVYAAVVFAISPTTRRQVRRIAVS